MAPATSLQLHKHRSAATLSTTPLKGDNADDYTTPVYLDGQLTLFAERGHGQRARRRRGQRDWLRLVLRYPHAMEGQSRSSTAADFGPALSLLTLGDYNVTG